MRCGYRWVPAFFGLTPEDREIYLEQSFLLMYYMGFSYWECYNIPIRYREWFITRLNKELSRNSERENTPTRAAHQNDAQTRAMMGMQRGDTPARLRRFT
jgi:hypothetical protein